MNRIILIGNGFDLAHGMKTGYKDFINDFWEKICIEIKEYAAINPNKPFENEFIKIYDALYSWKGNNDYKSLELTVGSRGTEMLFKNLFLKTITELCYIPNWVDIENEYYKSLIDCYSPPLHINISNNQNNKIQRLNLEFESIQKLLEEYLTKQEEHFKKHTIRTDWINQLKSNVNEVIYSEFELKDFSEKYINNIVSEEYDKLNNKLSVISENPDYLSFIESEDPNFPKLMERTKDKNQKEKLQIIRKLLVSSNNDDKIFRYVPDEILFLNFNYTLTESLYDRPMYPSRLGTSRVKSIHIHGTLNNINNKIIFGFGDELDKAYEEIENLNDNDYLKNIKSFKYFESESYKELLEFINQQDYQIFLFGHSCGNSDRTLLNTLFEHENCKSIKHYYYKSDANKDNYNDITMNISRSFTSKADMRDKVVNKKYCTALFN
ncbi:hypothetical protein HZP82_04685 [Elizabethkingia anophelis]|nr:hypothetical protein [Elizabethkingia anophelis]MCT4104501.1 hypothetical protein [Elizabethkingia anophelis]